MELEKTIQFIDVLKDSLNKEWLDKKLEEIRKFKPDKKSADQSEWEQFHPLAYLIHLSDSHVNSIRDNQSKGASKEMIRISTLGEYIQSLQENNANNLKEEISELMSDNHSQIEKTIYEITVAGSLSRRGHFIEFIATKANESEKTPDLLIDSKYEIECKKKDPLTKRDISNRDNWNIIKRKVYRMMDKLSKNACVYVYFKTDVTKEIRDKILKNLRRCLIDPIKTKFIEMDYELKISMTPKKNQILETTIPLSITQDEILTNFQKYLPETYELYMNDKSILDLIRKNSEVYEFSFDAKINNLVNVMDLRSIGFKMSEPSDRLKSVVNSITHAKKQFSREKVSIIFIELNTNTGKWQTSDFQVLDKMINEVLKTNTSISGVVISSEQFMNISGEVGYGFKARLYKNSNAKNPIPENFDVILLNNNQ